MGRQKHAPPESRLAHAPGLHNASAQICSSGKVCFPSQELARGRAAAARAESKLEIYWYHCPECDSWHHTKSPTGHEPLPPTRQRLVSAEKIGRVIRMLLDADDLGIDAMLAYPSGGTSIALEACRLACAEAALVRTELLRESDADPARGSLARELVDAHRRVDVKRTALARLLGQ